MNYNLNKKYQDIYNIALPYYKKGREADDLHHLVVAKMMQYLLKEYSDLDQEVMMVAALLHDIGYSKFSKQEKKIHWANKIKKIHMQYGAELAKKVLLKLNFSEEKIKIICEIISVHDNPEFITIAENPAL
ncbi:HD domain-containing protein [Candidatus Beckwithbacteria bacterium]|nr:HD domain-containing protein [Candidatus Beckwithbacteria bacterium]